ncbi:hypothetical protein MMC29_003224 [Sticta canariensis]|nr:hypothetical protein [Sticta canariensis]
MADQRTKPWALWITATKFDLLEVLSLSSRLDRPRFGSAFIIEQHLECSQLPLSSDILAIAFLKKFYRSHGPISLSLEGKDEDNNIFIRCSSPSKDSVSNPFVTFLIWVTSIERNNKAGVFLMRHGCYFKEPASEAKDGLATKVSGTHLLDEESLQNGHLAPRTASERFKDSTPNLEFSQVSLKTVEADHEAEWFSVPEPFDGPDCVENDWLILDASEL